jgi:hypothetical protein
MRILKHPTLTGRFLAVAPESDDLVLCRADLTVFRLDIEAFGQVVASTLGLGGTLVTHMLAPNVMRLGYLAPQRLNLYLAIVGSTEDFAAAVSVIESRDKANIGVITPSVRFIPSHLKGRINEGLLQHAELRALIQLTDEGCFQQIRSPSECFSPAPDIRDAIPEWFKKSEERLLSAIGEAAAVFRSTGSANERLKQTLSELADGADRFLAGLKAKLTTPQGELFFELIALVVDEKDRRRVRSYGEIGRKLGITKQAVQKRYKTLCEAHPSVRNYIEAIREQAKAVNFSEMSPKERRKQGVDESYDHEVG